MHYSSATIKGHTTPMVRLSQIMPSKRLSSEGYNCYSASAALRRSDDRPVVAELALPHAPQGV